MRKFRLTGVLVTVLFCAFLSSCIISHHSHTKNTSPEYPISKSQLSSVESGVTTKRWVLDTFGEPTREKHLEDGEELIIYENKKKTSHHFSLFLIFSTHSSEESKSSLTFRVRDGVVQSYWID